MTIPQNILDENPGVSAWSIIHAYRGSIAHGMYVPSSDLDSIDDKDTMSFCVPPIDYYYGLAEFGSRGTQEIKRGEWDIVVYEARKAIRLLAQGNPNVLSMLWLPDDMILKVTDAGRLLLDHRELFVGRHVYKPFVGYATAQLRKMEHGAYQGYMGERRRKLVDRYGYDAKMAAHLIRLLRMGVEFLREGEMHVYRQDADELLSIKRGEWSIDRVKREAERLFQLAEQARDASTLTEKPNRDKVNALCVRVVRSALSEWSRP